MNQNGSQSRPFSRFHRKFGGKANKGPPNPPGFIEVCSKKELARIWGSDLVHLTPEGYSKLAEKITEKAAGRKNGPSGAAGPIKASPTMVKATVRKQGLSRSDLTASRWCREAAQPGRPEHSQQTKPSSSGHQSGHQSGKRTHSGIGGRQSSKKRY